MLKTREIVIKLQYNPSKFDKEKGISSGGVMTPKFTKELSIDAYDDYDFDLDSGEFIKNGLLALQISGTGRALKEFGKFLINIAEFKTKDEDYHEHLDNILDSEENPYVNLTVRKI